MTEPRKPAADEQVSRWAARLPKRDAFLSVVTIREIESGVLKVERRDPEQGARLRSWLEDHVSVEYVSRRRPPWCTD